MRDRIAIIDIATKKFKALSYKQYDENNLLQIVVTKNKEVIDISEYNAYVYFELPSGKVYEIQPNIVNNTIDIILSSKILNEYGKITFEIELRKWGEIITVFSMYLNVEKSINEEITPINPGEELPNVRHTHTNKDVLDIITMDMLNQIGNTKIDLSDYVTKDELKQNTQNFATEDYVMNKIDEAKIEGGTGQTVDLSRFATKEQIDQKADDLFKIDTSIVSPLGGITMGEDLNNVSIHEILTKLLYPYVEPTIYANLIYEPSNRTIFEYGEIVEIIGISTDIVRKSKDIISISFLRDGYMLDSYTANVSYGGQFIKTFSYPIEIKMPINNTYFQVKATDANNTIVVANTKALNFYYPYYYGIIEETQEIDSYMVREMLNKQVDIKGNKTFTFSPKNQRIVMAYPKEYGELKSILDPNGFEQIASFNCIELDIECLDNTIQTYYVYYNKPSTNRNFRMSFYY